VLKVDISLFMRQVEAVVPWLVAASVVLIFLQITLGGVRWWVVMRALTQPFPIAQALAGYYIGNLASQILPGAIAGDAVRIWCARRTGLPLNSVINSVVLERFVTVLGLALVVTALQPVLLARVSGIPGSWVFPALTVAGILGGTVLCVLDRLPSIWQRWRLVRGLVKLAVDTRRLFVLSPYGLLALAIAIISQGNLSFSVWVLAHGLGLPVSFLDCMVLVPPVILVMTVPISIAGWGVRETAMVVAFGFIGLNGTSALALSLFFGLTTLVGALLGGIFFLLIKERGVTIPPNIAFLSEEP
jgi:uncharacterized membrane protein YbhN (UPF0104 family)